MVFRHLAVMGEESVGAAEASECAGEQGQFWEYHDVLFENWAGENVGGYSKSNLQRFAETLDLDLTSFNSCLDEGRYSSKINDDISDAKAINVVSVPTTFINGRRIVGLEEYSYYRQIIEEELEKAR